MKKSGTHVPRVELVECGPHLDLSVRRYQAAPEDLLREAMRQSTENKKKKEKNVSFDPTRGKVGRIYMPRQEVDTIALNKFKGGKRKAAAAGAEGGDKAKSTAPAAAPAAKKQRRSAADQM